MAANVAVNPALGASLNSTPQAQLAGVLNLPGLNLPGLNFPTAPPLIGFGPSGQIPSTQVSFGAGLVTFGMLKEIFKLALNPNGPGNSPFGFNPMGPFMSQFFGEIIQDAISGCLPPNMRTPSNLKKVFHALADSLEPGKPLHKLLDGHMSQENLAALQELFRDLGEAVA